VLATASQHRSRNLRPSRLRVDEDAVGMQHGGTLRTFFF
jgi:hypothetical protein